MITFVNTNENCRYLSLIKYNFSFCHNLEDEQAYEDFCSFVKKLDKINTSELIDITRYIRIVMNCPYNGKCRCNQSNFSDSKFLQCFKFD